MAATRKLNMFEKMANSLGAIYRYHKGEFPRRWDIFQKVAKRELAPPMQADLPAIKKDFAALQKVIESGAYKQYTLREALVYTGVGLEILWWFFVGEMIGRRNIYGYLVPADYVSKEAKQRAYDEGLVTKV